MIRVAVVDNDKLALMTIERILDPVKDQISIVSSTRSAEECVKAIVEHKPDVVVVDLQLPGASGRELIELISANTDARAVVVTSFMNQFGVKELIRIGALGYVTKDSLGDHPDDLRQAIEFAYDGRPYMSLDVQQRFQEEVRAPELYGLPKLTDREYDVVRGISDSLKDREIAEQLGIGERTVHGHVRNILSKWDARSRNEITALALQNGVVVPSRPHRPLQRDR